MTEMATILAVDDDDEIRRLVSEVLSRAGFRVLSAESGESALEILNAGEQVDVLLTDVVMPGLGGRGLVRRAKQLRPGLRVIMASGYWPYIVAALGDDDYLSKPYLAGDLVASIRRVLARGSADAMC
jgi:CheY-like chemotaxis protein